eukprot:GILJ01038809.1.p1 GENE.GILJ01038809.1~~GILJ01038809.1.p1  ORF type:complete len:269 (+),score=8.97 GILJ01038809.1:151-957(+)
MSPETRARKRQRVANEIAEIRFGTRSHFYKQFILPWIPNGPVFNRTSYNLTKRARSLCPLSFPKMLLSSREWLHQNRNMTKQKSFMIEHIRFKEHEDLAWFESTHVIDNDDDPMDRTELKDHVVSGISLWFVLEQRYKVMRLDHVNFYAYVQEYYRETILPCINKMTDNSGNLIKTCYLPYIYSLIAVPFLLRRQMCPSKSHNETCFCGNRRALTDFMREFWDSGPVPSPIPLIKILDYYACFKMDPLQIPPLMTSIAEVYCLYFGRR